ARAAHLVEGVGGDGLGNAGGDGGLSTGSLALTGLEDVAHPDFLDLRRVDAGTLEGGLDGDGAELRRGERGQGPQEAPDGSTGCADDHDVTGHWLCSCLRQSIELSRRAAPVNRISSRSGWD